MRKFLLFIVTIISTIITMSCVRFGGVNIDKVKLSGVTVTRTIPITGKYTKIEVGNAIEVQVSNLVDQLTVTSDSSILSYLEFTVRNNTLVLKLKDNSLWVDCPIKVRLPYQAGINAVDLSGAASLSFNAPFSEDNFNADLSGASSLQASVTAHSVELNLSGASSVSGSMTASNMKVKASGASSLFMDGTVDALNVELDGASEWELNSNTVKEISANKLTGEISGASEMQVVSEGTISVGLSGSSTLRYKGSANTSTSSISGESQIVKL